APECRAATAMIQAGIIEIIICRNQKVPVDVRWAVPLELERANDMLVNDVKIKIQTIVSGDLEKTIHQSSTVQFLNTSKTALTSKKIIS
ncbi:MAG: hypothetical protein K2Q32_03880, partial [Alphaproteobacteria bacterium]|nr:hypothetical protein [Alphaproteobacteria bacterium]